jgi:hypothetical protein
MLGNALLLCGAAFGTFYTYDGEHFKPVAFRNVAPGFAELMIKYGSALFGVGRNVLTRAVADRVCRPADR